MAGEALAARVDLPELGNIELLGYNPHMEVDVIGRWEIDLDLIHVEPKEKSLHLNALEIFYPTVHDGARDPTVVVDQILELDVARLFKFHHKIIVVGEGEARD